LLKYNKPWRKTPRQAESEWAVKKWTDAGKDSFVDMSVFYVILLVGFAYVWYRGDLDWVRAVANQRSKISEDEV